MNKFLGMFLLFIMIISFIPSYGFNKSSIKNSELKKEVVQNLLIGLQSKNFGLRTSSAYILGEIRAEEAVLPLMKMLRTEKSEEARIVAALALYKIKETRGIFAIKQAVRFDDSERVQKNCSNFYNQYLREEYKPDDKQIDKSEVALR
jgi:HEAT repeats